MVINRHSALDHLDTSTKISYTIIRIALLDEKLYTIKAARRMKSWISLAHIIDIADQSDRKEIVKRNFSWILTMNQSFNQYF
jgi:hypothetical protein